MSQTLTRPPAPADTFSLRAILAPMAAIVLGTFMAILDTTVVNVALPTFERVFRTDLHLLQWVITGYMLAQAAVIPLSGWFSDRFGAKRIYLTALVLFTLGSVLCSVAASAEMLVVFRVLQGLGGGMLMPVGMAVLYRLAPPERRGMVMGVFGIPILLGPALGPVISGWLLEYASWHTIFLINLPVGIAALLVGVRALPVVSAQRAAGSLDLLGMVLGPLAFAALIFGISESTAEGWGGPGTLGGIGLGLLALAAFVVWEVHAEHPLLDLHVFRSRDFSLTIVTSWATFAAMFGTTFLVPLFLQQVAGYGSFTTGLFSMPQALMAAITMPIGGRLFDRFGAKPTVLGGLALVATAMWLLSGVTAASDGWDLVPALALWGAGMGLIIMPLNTHLLNSAPRDLVSRVTSLTGALQSVVGSLAIASFATLLQGQIAARLAASVGSGQAPADVLKAVQALAFGDVYRSALAVMAVAFLLALALRRTSHASHSDAGAGADRADEREPVMSGMHV